MKALLVALACCCLLVACRKNRNTNELVGKWKLIETCRIGQAWQGVSFAEEYYYTFNNDYTFTQTLSLVSSSTGCTGTYRITNSNTVMMTFSCPGISTYEDELGFTRNGNMLILDHRNTASGIKTKYLKE